MLKIPKELQPYVRISKIKGLIHSDNMPEDLLEIFEKTRKEVLAAKKSHIDGLNELIAKEN